MRLSKSHHLQQAAGPGLALLAAILICGLMGLTHCAPGTTVPEDAGAVFDDVDLSAPAAASEPAGDNVVVAASSVAAEELITTALPAPTQALLPVCQDAPADSQHPDPDNCQAFITCDGKGSGTKTLCAAGTGYSQEKQSCLQLADKDGTAGGGCVFATQAPLVTDIVQAAAAAVADGPPTGAITYTCTDGLLQDVKGLTTENVAITKDQKPVFGGASRCVLADVGRPGGFVFKVAPADGQLISTIRITYYQRGPGAVISYGSWSGAANPETQRNKIQKFIKSAVPAGPKRMGASAATAEQVAAQDIWVPGVVSIPFVSLPHTVSIALADKLSSGAEVQIVSFQLTTTGTPPSNVAPPPAVVVQSPGSVVAASAADNVAAGEARQSGGAWVPPTPEEVQSYSSSFLLARQPSGRKLLQQPPSWQVSLSAAEPDFLSGSSDPAHSDRYLRSWQEVNMPSQCYRPTYGRGVGGVPNTCGAGQEYDAGLCYEACKPNFKGVGPVCWERCPAGYRDDGVTCYKSGDTKKAVGKCPAYDLCGLWKKNSNCKTCDAGYKRDGCLCTRYPDWHTKSTYTRGPKTPGCGGSKPDYDAGLCYAPCNYGYSGVGPVCWANCPDSQPFYCGASKASSAVCSRDSQACGNFISKVVTVILDFVVSIASAVLEIVGSEGALSAEAVMAVIEKGTAVATTFSDTPTCDKPTGGAQVHMASGLAVMEFDRDFAGYDVASVQTSSYDECMVKCAQNAACEFAVFGGKWQACWLKTSPGFGPNGANAYNPELRTGVAIHRVHADRANFQWAKGADVELPGSPVSMGGSSGSALNHSNVKDKRNLALCTVICMGLKDCTHVVYTDTQCFFKNAAGAHQAVPSSAGPVRGTLVNMDKYNWDKQ